MHLGIALAIRLRELVSGENVRRSRGELVLRYSILLAWFDTRITLTRYLTWPLLVA